MIPYPPIRLRTGLQILAASLAAIVVGILIPISASSSHLSLFLGSFLIVIVIGGLFAVPIRHLPAITLLVTLLAPTEVTLLPRELQGAALGIIPLAIWMIRAPKSAPAPTPLRILAFVLGLWLILSEMLAPLHSHRGLEWMVTVGLSIVFSVLSPPKGANARNFRTLFLNVTTLLGLYALLEGFVLHRNPLFGALFEHTTWWAAQHVNASYRVTTLLGHPLFNGLVFSAAAVLTASELAQRSRRTVVSLSRFIILVGATDATHSRGATLALAIGVLVVIVFSRGSGQGWATRRFVLALSFFFGGALLLLGLQARNESHEGQASAQVRVTVIEHAKEAVHVLGPFGAGPGESEAYRRAKRLPGWEVDLENSYAELAVSLGPVGALLMAALLIGVVISGLRNDAVAGEAAALLTILVDIAGFNAIEGHSSVGILIALFIITILTAPRLVTAPDAHDLRADSTVRGTSQARAHLVSHS